VKEEVRDQEIFLIFDGTTRLGEAFACVGRFVDDSFTVKQRLLSFKTLKQSMTGVQIAFSVAQSLSEAGIPNENLLGTNRDGASVNEVAMSTLQEFRETNGCSAPFWNLKCLAHFLNLVGERMSSNLARSFLAQWKSMMGHSVKARNLFREVTGQSFISSSATRWWSEWEQVDQICALYPKILDFLKHEDAPDSCKTIVSCSSFRSSVFPLVHHFSLWFQRDCAVLPKTQVQLACLHDYGERFVKTCTKLEGDGPVVLEVFELMEALKAQVTSPNFPSAHLIISQLKITSPYVNLKSSFDPARDYFLANLPDMRLYRAAEYLNPVKVRILYCFRVFSFLFSCSLAEKRSPSCRSLPVASKSWERQETCKENCLTTRPLPLDASMGWTSWTGGRRMEPSSQPGELQQKRFCA